jgi:hypothetical protein
MRRRNQLIPLQKSSNRRMTIILRNSSAAVQPMDHGASRSAVVAEQKLSYLEPHSSRLTKRDAFVRAVDDQEISDCLTSSNDAVFRVVPSAAYGYLDYPLASFFRRDRLLSSACKRLFLRGVVCLGHLVQMSPAELLSELDGDRYRFGVILRHLKCIGLDFDMRAPAWTKAWHRSQFFLANLQLLTQQASSQRGRAPSSKRQRRSASVLKISRP